MRLSILLATALTIALVAAAPANAGSACITPGGTAFFAAADVGCPGGATGPGGVNALSVSVNSAGAIVFTDANNAVTDADGPGGCSVSGNTATCPGALSYRFDLGDGDDSATVGAVANGGAASTGGDGRDHLVGGPLGDFL